MLEESVGESGLKESMSSPGRSPRTGKDLQGPEEDSGFCMTATVLCDRPVRKTSCNLK